MWKHTAYPLMDVARCCDIAGIGNVATSYYTQSQRARVLPSQINQRGGVILDLECGPALRLQCPYLPHGNRSMDMTSGNKDAAGNREHRDFADAAARALRAGYSALDLRTWLSDVFAAVEVRPTCPSPPDPKRFGSIPRWMYSPAPGLRKVRRQASYCQRLGNESGDLGCWQSFD